MSNKPSNNGVSADRLRAVTWEQWVFIMSKVECSDSDIVRLAEAEAERQYQATMRGLDTIALDDWWVDVTKKWATWQALVDGSNAMMGGLLLANAEHFAGKLETFITELVSQANELPGLME